jgi:hypothetical protein
MIFLIITSLLLLGASIYAGVRIWYLAGTLADAQEYIEELEVTNRYMYSRITEAYDVMKQIDRLGAFAEEDEAGTTFQLLNEVITELKETFDGEAQEEK